MEALTTSSKLNAEQKERLITIEQQLAELLPKSTTGFDEQNVALATNLDLVKQLNNEKKIELLSSATTTISSLQPSIEQTKKDLETLEKTTKTNVGKI